METTVLLEPESAWRERKRWYSDWAPDWLKPALRPRWRDRITEEELTDEMARHRHRHPPRRKQGDLRQGVRRRDARGRRLVRDRGAPRVALLLPALFFVGLGSGCAQSHGAMRGSVVMRVSETDAHVCLGSGEVSAGDSVELYRNVCASAAEPSCTREGVGRGTVTAILSDHYSTVRFPPGTAFKEGDTVEKATTSR